MDRRVFLKATAAMAAAAALPAPSFAASFEKKYAEVLGHKMAYVDEGVTNIDSITLRYFFISYRTEKF